MSARASRIFSIAPGAPFLDVLADALIAGDLVGDVGWGRDPLLLADVTVYLPTRRAARAFAGVLSRRARGPAILPRITPLGDADEAELRLIGDERLASDDDADLRPAARPAERLIFLADLVMRWRKQLDLAITPAAPAEHRLIGEAPHEAFALARDLMRVLDTLTIEGVTAETLAKAAPFGEQDRYWEISRAFLEIATRVWPLWLADRALADPVARANDVLRARARQIADGRAPGPIVAAGSTGTNPATADLLAAIARHARGAVVLPGLDLLSTDESFAAVTATDEPAHGHPQAALARLLSRLNAARADVVPLGAAPPTLAAREALLSQSMQPAAETVRWANVRSDADMARAIAEGLEGVAIVEADNDREEALAIALALRDAIRTPGRTAALATPDRALAERVTAALARWNIDIDDSAGRSLARSAHGGFAALAARWLADPADGALMTALLSHPDVQCGLPRAAVDRAAAAIDIGLLRGHAAPGDLAMLKRLAPLRRELANGPHAPRAAKRFDNDDWAAADRLLDELIAIAQRFADAGPKNGVAPIGVWAAAHRDALIALARRDATPEAETLFTGPDGEALQDLFDALAAGGAERAPLASADYPAVIRGLLDGETLNPPSRTHPRLAIWGLLEARLLRADRIILGGLNETVWPPQPSPDAFLNRALRASLALPQPERRIGQTAHDFLAAFASADDAVLTRARKSGGAPTIPSRFWQRLAAFAGDSNAAWSAAVARGKAWADLARALDDPGETAPVARPAPRPPADLVPRRLSVTRVETLVRDPYAIFARGILQLDPLPEIGVVADAALRGEIVHAAAARFAQTVDPREPDALDRLIAIGEQLFAEAGVDPERILFWRPAFRRAARPFIAWERERRGRIAHLDIEANGRIALPLDDGSTFELTARADRIELLTDGTLALVDFKTGAIPSRKQVASGFSPQLTLEAAMAKRGGFGARHRNRDASSLAYVRLSGARSGKFENDMTRDKDAVDPTEAPEKHLAQLVRRMNAHLARRIAFESHAHRDPQAPDRGGDYDHLARVAEWTRGGGDDE